MRNSEALHSYVNLASEIDEVSGSLIIKLCKIQFYSAPRLFIKFILFIESLKTHFITFASDMQKNIV